jgi:cation:H+ antiporter
VDWFDLIVALLVILLGSQLFTNGVEWVGEGFGLSDGVVGSVFAAIGTALPETIIPVIAILGNGARGPSADEIGIGAILGAPFMLATLAMAVLAASVLIFGSGRRPRRSGTAVRAQPGVIRQDLAFFLVAYPLAMVAGAWHPRPLRYALGVGLVALYVLYVRTHLIVSGEREAEAEASGEIQPLYLLRWTERVRSGVASGRAGARAGPSHPPPILLSIAQVLLALVLIVGAARIFVDAMSRISAGLGVSSLVFALLVAPVATELPEQFNGVLWLRRGKDTLAIGNVTGAMVFQSTLPVTIGLVFTPWHLSQEGLVSGLVAIAAAVCSYLAIRLRGALDARLMLAQAVLYAGYVVYILLRV